MKDLLQLLEYNFWANDLFITRTCSQAYIPAPIERQMSHILAAHQIWLSRINGRGTLSSVWPAIDVSSWEGINIELYNETTDLIKSTPAEHIISYHNSQGNSFQNTFLEIIHHLLNHSTHHRAQVALLMRQHDILPPQSDYIVYLRDHL